MPYFLLFANLPRPRPQGRLSYLDESLFNVTSIQGTNNRAQDGHR